MQYLIVPQKWRWKVINVCTKASPEKKIYYVVQNGFFFYSLPLYFGKVSRQTSEVNRAATSLFSRSIKTLTFEWFYKKKMKKNSFFVVRKWNKEMQFFIFDVLCKMIKYNLKAPSLQWWQCRIFEYRHNCSPWKNWVSITQPELVWWQGRSRKYPQDLTQLSHQFVKPTKKACDLSMNHIGVRNVIVSFQFCK